MARSLKFPHEKQESDQGSIWETSEYPEMPYQSVWSGNCFDFLRMIRDTRGDHLYDLLLFDTPELDDSLTFQGYHAWLSELFTQLNTAASRDAALILLPTNQKGRPFQKSTITEMMALEAGWQFCTEKIWDRGTSYLRPQFPYRKIEIFRRGNMPMQIASPYRYVDVIRHPFSSSASARQIGEIPSELIQGLIRLFPVSYALDPFAGSGSLSIACAEERIQCDSCELDPEQAKLIIRRLQDWHDKREGHE